MPCLYAFRDSSYIFDLPKKFCCVLSLNAECNDKEPFYLYFAIFVKIPCISSMAFLSQNLPVFKQVRGFLSACLPYVLVNHFQISFIDKVAEAWKIVVARYGGEVRLWLS